VTSLIKWL
jgi:hypothetical protein